MKRALRNWIRAIWCGVAKRQKDATAANNGKLHHHDLAIYRLKSKQDFEQLTQATERGWLSFIAFGDDADWFWFSANKSRDDIISGPISGEALLIGDDFFEDQHRRFIDMALHNLLSQQELCLLDKSQRMQWQWIINKIECTLVCNYEYRRAYLQELVLQAFHFALKQITVHDTHTVRYQNSPQITLI